MKKFLTYENGLLLILGLTFGFVFVDRNALTNLMPLVAADLKLNNTQIGFLGAVLSLAWAVSGYIVGLISDRAGKRKPFLIMAVVVFSICTFMSGIAQSFSFLIAARFLLGLSEGPILPLSQGLMIPASSPGRVGINTGVLQNAMPNLLGSGIAPIVLVILAEMYGWRTAFFVAGVPGLICAGLIWLFAKEPAIAAEPEIPAHGDAKAALSSLHLLKIRNIALCSAICVFMVAWLVNGWVWLPLFYTKMRGVAPKEMGWLMSSLGFGAVVFAFIVPWLSERFGRKPILAVFALVGALVPVAALYGPSNLWLLGALVGLGWSATGTFGLFMATVPSETIPARYLGAVLGVIQGLGEILGGFGSPFLAGWLADQSDLNTPMYLMGFCSLAAAVLALFLTETAPAVIARRQLAAAPGEAA